MQGFYRKTLKKLALWVMDVYKFLSKQIRFEDFNQPIGMKMSRENRWVKKANLIPWEEIELGYAKLFTNKKGNVAKPLRMALGALIIQTEYGYSDVETMLQIQETAYLQYFCGISEYSEERPFDPSLMVYFRKRLTPEILGEINEMILKNIQKPKIVEDAPKETDDDKDNHTPPTPPNDGTLIVDATCAPSKIKYPQDTELLNQSREYLEDLIDTLHKPIDGIKPRTYRKQARKDYLNLARKKKRTAKDIRKAIGKQLRYVKRNLAHVDGMKKRGATLTVRQEGRLDVVKTVYQQQLFMFDNHTHKVADRIVSISQPYIRPIVRGKAKAPVEFGIKLDISVVDGFVRLEKQSFDAYNEGEYLMETIERYRQRTGHYPARVLADKIYRNRENLNFCKENEIRLAGPALGRPKKDAIVNRVQNYLDECERVEVERAFSLAKGKFGMGLIRARLEDTTKTVVALSILTLNLAKVLRTLLHHFWIFMKSWLFEWVYEKMVFVQ